MRVLLVALAAVGLALLSFTTPASAQDVTGPSLSTTDMTLWTHSGGGSKWLSTLNIDEAAVDVTVNLAFPGTATQGSCAAFPLLPAQAQDIVLDTAADIQFNIRFGSGLAANAGTLSTSLTYDGTELAAAEWELDTAANTYESRNMVAKSSQAVLPAGGSLVWNICFEGAGTAYIQVGQSDQWCTLVLPILSPGPDAGLTNVTDVDLDGLNDTWEMEQFGNITLHNGSADPDSDGLNNTAEFDAGTNATNADTDGDGVLDGQEVLDGTDPLVADVTTVVDDDDNTTIEDDSDEGDAGTQPKDSDKAGLDKYLESIKADTDYAGASAGGLAGVVVLSLIGLAGRWGL